MDSYVFSKNNLTLFFDHTMSKLRSNYLDMITMIANQMATIDDKMCKKMCRNVVIRLEMCIEYNSEYFEHSE